MNDMLKIARTAAIAASLALTAPAFAAETDSPPQATVALHGADLTSPRAVAQLKHRLHRVAMDICTPHASGSIFLSRDERECYDTAMHSGLAQIDSRQQQAIRDRAVRLADTSASGRAVN